jgi:hypothetical protein
LLRTHNAKEEAGIYAMLAQNEPAYIARLTAEHDGSNSCSEHRRTAARAAHSLQTAFAVCKTTSSPTSRTLISTLLQTLSPEQWDMVDDAHVNMFVMMSSRTT